MQRKDFSCFEFLLLRGKGSERQSLTNALTDQNAIIAHKPIWLGQFFIFPPSFSFGNKSTTMCLTHQDVCSEIKNPKAAHQCTFMFDLLKERDAPRGPSSRRLLKS